MGLKKLLVCCGIVAVVVVGILWYMSGSEELTVADNECMLVFQLDTQEEIQSISMDYIIDDEVVETSGIRNADGSIWEYLLCENQWECEARIYC
jgi:hypothetical protein